MLLPKYTKYLDEIVKMKQEAEDAYTSDLDIDLTLEADVDVDLMKNTFKQLVPEDHKYFKQYTTFYESICSGTMKNNIYERFFFDLLQNSPRCEHCMSPLQNNNNGIKNHINYYHYDIDLSLDKYSYLDIHRYMSEIYKYPYLILDTSNKKTSTLCPVPSSER